MTEMFAVKNGGTNELEVSSLTSDITDLKTQSKDKEPVL